MRDTGYIISYGSLISNKGMEENNVQHGNQILDQYMIMHESDQTQINSENTNSLTRYKYLIFFCMFFMCIMICNAILTNRYISFNRDIFVLGGTLTSPLIFILGDIVAEIFGYKVAKQMIWCGFICQMIFAIICGLVARAPYPMFFKDHHAYSFVFSQLMYIVMSSFVAYIASGLINILIITRWKVLLQGRYFWLRSLGSSTIAEALYSAIAILMMEIGSLSLNSIWKVILISYLIKVIYSVVLAYPSNLIVNYIKCTAKIDVYDYPVNFNPFKKNKNELLQAETA